MEKLYSPKNEVELALVRSLLEAAGIEYFVHNDHFGSLEVGPCIPLVNAKTVLVHLEDLNEAREVIAELAEAESTSPRSTEGASLVDAVRMFFEVALFGWIMPGKARRMSAKDVGGREGQSPE